MNNKNRPKTAIDAFKNFMVKFIGLKNLNALKRI
nr:MAG TPA: hypothetical protein [Caudoviricetes sp.]